MPAFMLPVQSGMTQPACELLKVLGRDDAESMAACCARFDIEDLFCYLAVLPGSDHLIIHVQGRGSAHFLSRLSASRHPFDRQLCASLLEITGRDIKHDDAAQQLLPLIAVHAP